MTQTSDQAHDTTALRTERSLSRPMLALVVLALLTSTAALMTSRDILVRDQAQTTLQMAADRAAMAGAAYLPGWPARARRAAEQSAELSGFARSNLVYARVTLDGTSFRVALKCSAPVLLLGLFPSGAEVTATSTMGTPQVQRPVSYAPYRPAAGAEAGHRQKARAALPATALN